MPYALHYTASKALMASEMRKFWRSLKRHPGVLSAAAMTLFGFAVGGWGGAVIAGLYWVPVLLTAWEMRDRAEGSDDGLQNH